MSKLIFVVKILGFCCISLIVLFCNCMCLFLSMVIICEVWFWVILCSSVLNKVLIIVGLFFCGNWYIKVLCVFFWLFKFFIVYWCILLLFEFRLLMSCFFVWGCLCFFLKLLEILVIGFIFFLRFIIIFFFNDKVYLI